MAGKYSITMVKKKVRIVTQKQQKETKKMNSSAVSSRRK
jgi:hypothetical protein